jgi:hypothetical protein
VSKVAAVCERERVATTGTTTGCSRVTANGAIDTVAVAEQRNGKSRGGLRPASGRADPSAIGVHPPVASDGKWSGFAPHGARLVSRERTMSPLVLILVVVLIIVLLGGGYGYRSGNNVLAGGGGLLGLILIILLILFLLGRL